VRKRDEQEGERRENLTERIYRQVKQQILGFQLLPGDRFTENEIALSTSASRTPVREALNRLQREGFVEVSFRSGWQVRPFDFAQFEQLYDVRIALELAAAELLCEVDPRPDLTGLKQDWQVLPEHRLGSGPTLYEQEERFHAQVVEATGNCEMARIHHEVCERLRLVRRFDLTRQERIDATYEEHAQILQHLEARDIHAAQRLIRAHIEGSKAEVRKITLHMIFEARQAQNTGEPSTDGSPDEKARQPG
jgi:DNA-binding GntR family transcriptional regulator